MPFITREDGEHFVIPSYRDVLTSRNKTQLKKDILLLSQSYGDYITLRRKSSMQYEVAFSPDTGYLLGESIWHYFKRPMDLIYCEAIPNTSEALLVIVKSGSVYLDGSFPLDSIPEELVIFLTQQNNFEIYTYGDVPISQTPEEGKFSFEANAVKSFTILDKPVFATLPLLKIYQLQLVDVVLKAHGIGVFPTRQILIFLIALSLLFLAYYYFTTTETPIPTPIIVKAANPYLEYNTLLSSPAPADEMKTIVRNMNLFTTLPGWTVVKVDYQNKILIVGVKSIGGKVEDLWRWASTNLGQIDITSKGINVDILILVPNRLPPKNIYPLKQVVGIFVDRLSRVYPGNHMTVNDIVNKGSYVRMTFNVDLESSTTLIMGLIGEQLRGLPCILQKISLTTNDGALFEGSITLDALGSQL